MAMDINIRITVEADTDYSPTEKAVLQALAAHPSQGADAVWPPADRTNSTPAQAPEVTPAAAPKAAPVKATPAPRKPKAAPAKVAPVEDVPMALDVVDEEQAPAEAEAPAEAPAKVETSAKVRTLDEAITLTTDLVQQGKAALVKSALEAAGVKRVSQMDTDDKLAAFFATVEA